VAKNLTVRLDDELAADAEAQQRGRDRRPSAAARRLQETGVRASHLSND
jgi:hypothetical protein